MPPQPAAVAWVEAWEQRSPLPELQQLLDLSPRVRLALADRLHLHPGDLSAMEHLMGEPLGPVELSRRLGLTSAAATVAVDRLQERGHVVREPDPTDGRRTRVVVTPSGRADVFSELLPMFQALESAADDLSAEERVVVTRFLNHAIEALRTLL
ncbi:MAG: MarR family transcriptional regulator [Candidatus Nanopelagicales bacterium]|nr:MarR family transcriptional regulator [Candidatus Nanopelagicales bacterium]